MPTRYLKPGIRDSGRIEALSAMPDAECLYYRLIVSVDDFGRTDARPLMIKALCFPIRMRATADECAQWLTALADVGLIIMYEVDSKPYLQITRWDNKPRAAFSKYPPPPSDVYNCPQMLPANLNREPITVNREPITETKTKTSKTAHNAVALPDWLPLDHWTTFLAMRNRIRKPATARAQRILIGKLAVLRDQGYNPAQLLAESELKCWSSVYPPKE